MKEFLYTTLMTNGAGAATLSIETMLLNFLAAGICGLIIYISYRTTHMGAMYSKRFNVLLIMLTLITTLIMSVIGNNVALSLGMVGALSIIRFRTAIKDPRDTAYIFWTIAVGICCGVADYLLAVTGSVIIFFFLILLGTARNNERILLIVHGSLSADEEIARTVSGYYLTKAVLRVHNAIPGEDGSCEFIYELSDKIAAAAKKRNGDLQPMLCKIEGVRSVQFVRQDDEITQ